MPGKDNQGNLITSEKEQDESLREHFAEVLNCPEPNDQTHILEANTDLEIDTEEPSKTEICKVSPRSCCFGSRCWYELELWKNI